MVEVPGVQAGTGDGLTAVLAAPNSKEGVVVVLVTA